MSGGRTRACILLDLGDLPDLFTPEVRREVEREVLEFFGGKRVVDIDHESVLEGSRARLAQCRERWRQRAANRINPAPARRNNGVEQ
jgi:hypothetical protein